MSWRGVWYDDALVCSRAAHSFEGQMSTFAFYVFPKFTQIGAICTCVTGKTESRVSEDRAVPSDRLNSKDAACTRDCVCVAAGECGEIWRGRCGESGHDATDLTNEDVGFSENTEG